MNFDQMRHAILHLPKNNDCREAVIAEIFLALRDYVDDELLADFITFLDEDCQQWFNACNDALLRLYSCQPNPGDAKMVNDFMATYCV